MDRVARAGGTEVRSVLRAIAPDHEASPRPAQCAAMGAGLGALAVLAVLALSEADRRSRDERRTLA